MAEAFEQEKQEKHSETGQPEAELDKREQKPLARTSFWPLLLALALVLAGIGIMIHAIILACGIVLTIAAIIGWALEKH